jgi:uncharacterized protein YqgC (DUF456 family)
VRVLLYVVGVAALVAGVAGVVLPVLPGALLLVAGTVVIAWADHFQRVTGWTVALAVILGAAIWAVDLLASALGTRWSGASRWAMVGAAVGLLAGLAFGFPGVLLGPAVGALVFEYARNPELKRAARAGVGAFLGFVLGSAVKIALAFVLVGAVVLDFLF